MERGRGEKEISSYEISMKSIFRSIFRSENRGAVKRGVMRPPRMITVMAQIKTTAVAVNKRCFMQTVCEY